MIVRDRIRLVIYIILIVTLLAIIAFALSFLNLNGNITLPLSPTFLYRYDKNAIACANDSTVKLLCPQNDGVGKFGTGFLAIEPGVIVTCYHVIENGPYSIAAEMKQDRHTLFIESIIGYSEEDDIAFLRCPPTDTPLLDFANASDLENNQILIAIGCPEGNKDTVSYGFFKALDGYIFSTIKTAHGDSGGPLLNSIGNVVGINAGSLDGFGCSIPSEKVLEVWNNLKPEDEISIKVFAESKGNHLPKSTSTEKVPENG